MTKIGSVAPRSAGFWDQLFHPQPEKVSTGLHGIGLAINVGFAGWAVYELTKKHTQKESTLGQIGWGVQLALCTAFAAWDIHGLIHAYKYHQQTKGTIQESLGAARRTPDSVMHFHA